MRERELEIEFFFFADEELEECRRSSLKEPVGFNAITNNPRTHPLPCKKNPDGCSCCICISLDAVPECNKKKAVLSLHLV